MSFFLLAHLSDAEAEELLATAPQPMDFAKGAAVLPPDDVPALGVVLAGELLVRPRDGMGLVKRLEVGEAFGAAALFAAASNYVTDVVAASASVVRFLPEGLLMEWMQADFGIAENYMRFLSGRVRFLNRRIAALTAGTAEAQLLRFLQGHTPDENGGHRFAGGMSELAARLDMGRTSLYRALGALEQAGLIIRMEKVIFLL